MKAWQVRAWGEPETMILAEIPLPEPGPAEVRIRNRAAALNFFDLLQIQGKYQVKPPFPFTPGAEVAGVVDAVGVRVTGWARGDEVLALTGGGGLAEYSLAEENRVFRIPPEMGFAEAAAMPMVYHTALFALQNRAGLQAREWLLAHAGASGIGMAAIQIGKAMSARVIATAGSSEKLDFARAQGAEHLLNYCDAGWFEQVKEITGGRGADVICDPVGGDVFDFSTKCIAPGGRLLVVGFTSGRIPSIQTNRILLKNISIVGVHWGAHARANPHYVAEAHQTLAALYAAGQIRPVVGKTHALADAPAALRELADRKIMGKSVLLIQ